MKVLCINAGYLPGDVPSQPKLEVGKEYTVVDSGIGLDFKGFEEECYQLKEIHPLYCYQKERFIPIPNIEEEEEELAEIEEPKLINV